MSAERIAEIKTEIAQIETKNILDIEARIEALPDDKKLPPAPVKHYFAPGTYAREMFLAKGTLVVGKIHKHSHINIISYGHVKVATYEGAKEYEGHNVLISPAGVKRVVLAVEDTVWTTIHLTESTDLEEIENQIIAKDYDEIEFLGDMKKHLEDL